MEIIHKLTAIGFMLIATIEASRGNVSGPDLMIVYLLALILGKD